MEKKVKLSLGEETLIVTGLLNADIVGKTPRGELETFIFKEVERKMKKTIKEDFVGEVNVVARFIVISHMYEKVGEEEMEFVYSVGNGLKTRDNGV